MYTLWYSHIHTHTQGYRGKAAAPHFAAAAAAGGFMVGAGTSCKYLFDLRPGDVYWCTADCGWITGHTYLTYGPLLNGVTSVLFGSTPAYPDAGRCWRIVEKYNVSGYVGTSVSVIVCV